MGGGGGGGSEGLTSDSKWGLKTPFSQYLFINFKKVDGLNPLNPSFLQAMKNEKLENGVLTKMKWPLSSIVQFRCQHRPPRQLVQVLP